MVPLQNLNIVFLEIEAACEHARDVAITLHAGRSIEEFHDASILVVFGGSFRLRDKVGVIFNAHGWSLRFAARAICERPLSRLQFLKHLVHVLECLYTLMQRVKISPSHSARFEVHHSRRSQAAAG
jgi:hypothetical protein